MCLDTAESILSTSIVLPASFVVWLTALAHASTACQILSDSPSFIERFSPSAITAIRIVSLVNPGSVTVSSTGSGEVVSIGVGVGATGVTVGGGDTDGKMGSEHALATRSGTTSRTKSFEREIFAILQD